MVVVSIPEEFIMTFMALLGLRRFDYFDKYNVKSNLKNVFLKVVLPCTVLFTITLFGLELNIYVRSVINFLGFYIFMLLLLKGENKFRVFASALAAYCLSALIEVISWIGLIYIFKIDVSLINHSALTNLMLTLPVRILQIGILYMIYINKNSIFRFGVYELWNDNREFRRFTIIHTVFNIFFSMYIYSEFAINRCLISLSWETQLSIVTVICLIFVVQVIMPWLIMYIIYVNYKYINKHVN